MSSASNVASPEAFIESFPNASLPAIEGAPTYDSLSHLRSLLKANAASVPSTKGGGSHGYLGIVVSASVYQTIDPTAFTIPAYPGAQPAIPNQATAAQTNVAVRLHNESMREWREYTSLHQALKKQLTNAIDPIYLRAVRDRHVGYANLTLRELLAHLFSAYGHLTPQDLVRNQERMNRAWDPSTPFETLIDQVEDAIDIADAGNQAFTTPQIVNSAYTIVFNTGMFFDECKTWSAKPSADQTWTNFKTHFLAAQNLLRQQQTTSQQAGFHQHANAAFPTPEQDQATADALANLATATASDRQAFAALVTTNADLTCQLAEALSELKLIKKLIQNSDTPAPKPKASRNANSNYCWTHGYRVGQDHTSATCKNPKEGHQPQRPITANQALSTTYNRPTHPPSNASSPHAILDSGTTGHYILPSTPCIHRRPTSCPIKVQLPDGSTIQSTHQCHLALPNLPPAATEAHIFPDLKDHALISIGTLCDNGCTAEFTKSSVHIKHDDGTTVLNGTRATNGLWRTEIPQAKPPTPTAHLALQSSTTADLIKYLHATCFSPPKSTWIQAIDNGHFTTWPGLTSAAVRRHLPATTMATAMGHLDQQRQNTQSTKPKLAKTDQPSIDTDPTAEPACTDGRRTNLIYPDIILIGNTPTGAVHTDQTGRFPIQSSNGYQYLMILYDYDSNAILAAPMKNRTGPEILRVYRQLHESLVNKGLRPRLQRLDNEASQALKSFLRTEDIDFQLVPPHMHRRNAAERAIRTFKNHFTSGLASTDPLFPLHLWDRLLPQAVTTLNLLRKSRLNPNLSAYAQLHGNFDFNRTPMAPPGTRILAHSKPSNRASWAPHGEAGWYLGPAMEHYRCYRVHNTRTNAERISDTVEFFPTQVSMPQLSSKDAATHAAKDLIAALQQPFPTSPFPSLGDKQLEALRQLSEIFQHRVHPPPQATTTYAPAPRVTTAPAPRVAPTLSAPSPPNWNPPTFPGLLPTAWKPSKQPTPAANAAHRQPSANRLPDQQTPDTPLPKMFDGIHTHPSSPLSAHAVIDPKTGKSMGYRELIINPATKEVWQRSAANEFGRCAQGVGNRVQGTNTIRFIHHHEVPTGRNVTYARFVCTLRPQKKEIERTRLTVGGNLLTYPGDTSAPTANLTTFKCLVNSTLSTKNAKMGCADIKNFYLNTPMDRPEFMKIPLALIPDEIRTEYTLDKLVHHSYIYIRIEKGMYGLPQAGMLANKLLQKRLAQHGYYQCRHTPGLWKHTFRPIQFTLVVDDLAFEYVGREHADHLLNILRQHYEGVSIDWDASLYCGITLQWDYVGRTCDLSMPNYIPAALEKFGHLPPTRPQHSPHRHNPPQYGVSVQLTDPADKSPPLSPKEVTRIQQIIGTLLYYARAVDPTLLVSLSALASEQSRATQNTAKAVHQILDYCATHPHATIRYRASHMLLYIHSDAGYHNEPLARSRAGGHIYLGNDDTKPHLHNGPILNPTGILRHVASSATEAEVGALFVNLKEGTVLRQMLHDLGYPPPTTPVQTDNSTANGIANGTIKQQRSRAIDMRYYWIQDRSQQGHYRIYWAPGSTNLADYFTKHHSPAHHQTMRPTYLHQPPLEPSQHRANIVRLHCEGVLKPWPTSAVTGPKLGPTNPERLFERQPLVLPRAHDLSHSVAMIASA